MTIGHGDLGPPPTLALLPLMPLPQTPKLTVDVVITLPCGGIVVIERAHPPQGVAFPGGFVDVGEKVEDAAIREALEETGLDVTLQSLLGVYSDPRRDDRLHSVSCVWVATSAGTPRAASDAKRAFVVPLDALLTIPFVFDHAEMAADFVAYSRTGALPRPRPSR